MSILTAHRALPIAMFLFACSHAFAQSTAPPDTIPFGVPFTPHPHYPIWEFGLGAGAYSIDLSPARTDIAAIESHFPTDSTGHLRSRIANFNQEPVRWVVASIHAWLARNLFLDASVATNNGDD